MKNTFKILFLLAIILVILSLASCGNTVIDLPNDSGESTEATTAEKNEVNGSEASTCNHEYEEKILVAATCQKEGISKKTCKLCKTTENGTVPKAMHVEVIDPAIAATCSEAGKTEGTHCMNCNIVLKERETVEPLGHTEVIDEAIAATCTTPGKTEGKHCSVCNEVTLPQETVDALGHTEVIDEARAATCITTGLTEGKHCGVCEEVLVLQKHIDVLGHSTVKRTHTPVTCQANGIVEIYCTRCETVQNYETILKGHYSAEHEYTQITHESIGNLCVGYKHGDKCELCNARFIAPGTYTVVSFGSWQGTVQFKFDYYNNLGVKQSASKITQSQDALGYYTLKFDDYVAYGYDGEAYEYKKNYSGIITITEEAFAVVDQSFYGIFTQYFEAGEYTLSGKYEFREEAFAIGRGLLNAPAGTHNVSFKYLGTDGTEYHSDYIQILTTSDGPQMNYSSRGNVAYFSYSDEWGAYDSNFKPYVIFEAPQTVSKEFFEWFTSVATKVVA